MIHGPCFVSSLVSSRYTIQLTVFYALPSYLCSCCILSPVVLTKCLISAPLSYSNNHTCINGGYTGISYNINHIPERIVQGFALLTLSRRQKQLALWKAETKRSNLWVHSIPFTYPHRDVDVPELSSDHNDHIQWHGYRARVHVEHLWKPAGAIVGSMSGDDVATGARYITMSDRRVASQQHLCSSEAQCWIIQSRASFALTQHLDILRVLSGAKAPPV